MIDLKQKNIEITFRGLLAQLDLPVYKMRLITAQKIAQLLETKIEQYSGIFLIWLSERKFENEIITGLCILGLIKKESLIDQLQLQKNIKKPSILSGFIIEQIYGVKPDVTWKDQHSGIPKSDFKESDYFRKMSTNYLAPIYRNEFKRMENKFNFPFLRQWAWEYECLQHLLKNFQSSPDYYIEESFRGQHSGSYHLKVADVYCSAYLRTLACAVSEWNMPIDFAELISKNCVSLDFQLAKVNHIKKPKHFSGVSNIDKHNVTQKNVLNQTLNDMMLMNDEVLVAGSFPLCRTKTFAADIDFRSILLKISNLDVKEIFTTDQIYLPKNIMFHNWVKDESTLNLMKEKDNNKEYFLVSFQIFPNCFPRWQSELFMSAGVYLPSPLVIGGTPEVIYMQNQIQFRIKGKEVARYIYWFDDWKTSNIRELKPGIGSALLIQKKVFASYLKGSEYSLKAALQVKYKTKEQESYDYDDLRESCSDILGINL